MPQAYDTTKSQTKADNELLTYDEAARYLKVKDSTIKQLVYRKLLHPITRTGSPSKYISRLEIEWYDRRRQGAASEPNPYLLTVQTEQAGATLDTLSTVGSVQPNELPSGFGGIAMLFLVVILLLAILANRKPNEEQLEELRTAPELQPVRRAIIKLAGEIAA